MEEEKKKKTEERRRQIKSFYDRKRKKSFDHHRHRLVSVDAAESRADLTVRGNEVGNGNIHTHAEKQSSCDTDRERNYLFCPFLLFLCLLFKLQSEDRRFT